MGEGRLAQVWSVDCVELALGRSPGVEVGHLVALPPVPPNGMVSSPKRGRFVFLSTNWPAVDKGCDRD